MKYLLSSIETVPDEIPLKFIGLTIAKIYI